MVLELFILNFLLIKVHILGSSGMINTAKSVSKLDFEVQKNPQAGLKVLVNFFG